MYRGFFDINGLSIPLNACLVTSGHKCGKPNCKCTRGHLRQATALKYRVNGVQKKKYVRKNDVDAVKRKLYWTKGGQFFERADKYTISIFYKYPSLSRDSIIRGAGQVAGRPKKGTKQYIPHNIKIVLRLPNEMLSFISKGSEIDKQFGVTDANLVFQRY